MDGRQAVPPRRAFVGRRAELAAIEDTVAAARRGEPGLVWIPGAAGMGKSALLASAIGRVGPLDLLTATGDEAVDPRWERLLGTVHGARRLPLSGLAPAELSELAAVLGRPLGSTGAAERLWARTRGHPLHARTLLEELAPEVLAATTTDVL